MEQIRPIPLCLDLDLAKPLTQEGIVEVDLKQLTPEELENIVIAPEANFISAQ